MSLKENFAEQLKAQSDVWRAQAKDYQERMQQAGEQARAEYKIAMEQMETSIQDAAKLTEQVRSANEAAWKDMVAANQKAFAELSARLGRRRLTLSVTPAKRLIRHFSPRSPPADKSWNVVIGSKHISPSQ